ncbi:hypothetical protein Tco_1452652, partial [Tanacetum coccineum]
EVSLPRGKADKDDIDDADTMTREAKEMSRRKLIIQITRFHVLGSFSIEELVIPSAEGTLQNVDQV